MRMDSNKLSTMMEGVSLRVKEIGAPHEHDKNQLTKLDIELAKKLIKKYPLQEFRESSFGKKLNKIS